MENNVIKLQIHTFNVCFIILHVKMCRMLYGLDQTLMTMEQLLE